MINKYISEYSNGFKFESSDSFSYEVCGISVKVDTFEYNSDTEYREKAHVLLEKGDLKYECECFDRHEWENMFYPIKVDGKTCLLFRKTLYGFTYLNTETLTEEYDYFPKIVLNGEESFIIVDAKMLGDVIIFDGCYWACPYACVAYDHKTGLFVNLSDEYGITDDETIIQGDILVLRGMNGNYEKEETKVTTDEIQRHLRSHGKSLSLL